MIRTKDRFYWSDALYLARAKNLLTELEHQEGAWIFQCQTCTAYIKFSGTENHSGKWIRLKPYEQFLLQKKFQKTGSPSKSLIEVQAAPEGRKLYRCPDCASHWWAEDNSWNNADDAAVEIIE